MLLVARYVRESTKRNKGINMSTNRFLKIAAYLFCPSIKKCPRITQVEYLWLLDIALKVELMLKGAR